jgi:hypothetical protein
MIFGEKPFARLQLETGTDFNVFPGQVTSSGVEYVLELGDKWVMFDAENQEAVLVDRPREQSLFRKKKTTKHPHIVFIVIGNKYQLRMDGSMFKSHDLPGTQRSGLSIVTGSKSPVSQLTEVESVVLTSNTTSSFTSHSSLTSHLPRSRQRSVILRMTLFALPAVISCRIKLDGSFVAPESRVRLLLF